MSWQERIGAYQKGQELAALSANAEKLRLVQEKIPPLIEILNRLGCEELLTKMRDEVWQVGEVVSSPDLNNLTLETPIKAEVTLIAKWPVYHESYSSGDPWEGGETYHPPTITIHEERLAITAKYEDHSYSGKAEVIVYSSCHRSSSEEPSPLDPNDQEASKKLEKILIEDILERQKRGLSYASNWGIPHGDILERKKGGIRYAFYKERGEKKVVEEIANSKVRRLPTGEIGLSLPEGFGYLDEPIEKAIKALLAQQKAEKGSERPKTSLVGRLFGRS